MKTYFRTTAAFALGFFLMAWAGYAQTTVKADQGRPGNQGCWPVCGTFTGTVVLDGGLVISEPYQCNIASPNKLSIVDGGGTIGIPNCAGCTAQAGRVYTNVCNSPLNASGTTIICRADGTAPGTFGVAATGDVLQLGDCVTYTVDSSRTILCVANAVAANVNTYECY